MSGIEVQTTIGLRCYRELIDRETRCAYRWEQQFGKQALQDVRVIRLLAEARGAHTHTRTHARALTQSRDPH